MSPADKEDYKNELKDIRQVYEAWLDKLNEMLNELKEGDTQDAPRIEEVIELEKDLTKKMKKNEKEVKEKL